MNERSKSLLRILIITILALALSLRAQAQDLLTNGLVAYYPFSGNANDVWGGHNGQIVGSTIPITNRFGTSGGACRFDGTTYVAVPDSAAFHLQAMTISLWVLLDTVNGAVDLVNKDDFSQGFQFFIFSNNLIFLVGDGTWHSTAGNAVVSAGQWHHLVAT